MRLYFFLLTCFFPVIVFALTVVDDNGNKIELKKPAQRIISLAPDITEILFSIQANPLIVGVVSGCDYPSAARSLPVVGSYLGIDLERVSILHPDLIVTWGDNFSRQLAILKKQGIAVYVNRPKQIADVAHTMENLGILAGKSQVAHQMAEQYRQKLQTLKTKYSELQPVTVFYEIGDTLLTINKDSWINQAITLCGGRNVFANATLATPEIDLEALIQSNPQVIISGSADDNWQKRWRKWQYWRGMNKQMLFTVNPDLIERAGPRLVEGVTAICKYLQQYRKKG